MYLLLRSPSERLSTRLNNEVDINVKLSINLILYVMLLSFLIGTKKLCIFSPKHSNFHSKHLNSFATSLIIKRLYVEPL